MDTALVASNLEQVRETLRTASEGRFPPPKLIVVTKTHPAEDLLFLRDLGVTDVGENRVQEIREKLSLFQGIFQIHQIGRLQSNKVKYIIEDVSLIQSVDRLSLAEEIDRQARAHERVMPVLVQVSPAGEEQKGGMPPDEVRSFLDAVRKLPGLKVRGLMAVMPHSPDRVYLTGLFQNMRRLFEQLQSEAVAGVDMQELSMGMSGDYALAAACGATMVRVGSAILGPRG